MSEYLKSAVITAATTRQDAAKILEDNLQRLIEDYEFGFRGYGGIETLATNSAGGWEWLPLEYDGSAGTLDIATLEALLGQFRGLQLVGTMRLSGARRLYDVALGLLPLSSGGEAFVYTHLDAKLYNELWDEDDLDYIDTNAAERLRSLAITFGAHPLTDGFNVQNLEVVILDVAPFDGEYLRDSFLNRRTVQEVWDNRKLLRHGIVSGIKRELCNADLMRDLSPDCEVLETITGHVVVSALVEIDPSLFEGLDD